MRQIRESWTAASIASRQLGLIVFEEDPVSAPTMQALLAPAGIDIQVARIPFPQSDASENGFIALLQRAAGSILPSDAPAVIGFACTTGAIQIGRVRLMQAVARSGFAIEAVTPIDGIVAALRALGIGRVNIVSPYAKPLSGLVAQHIVDNGFAVPRLSYFDAGDADITSISADSVFTAARRACRDQPAEAIFLSCTGMRATPLIEAMEAELGIPVLTSLQVMAWRAARLLGLAAPGPGRLFDGA